ncbi:MAG: DUF5103 domain-containing protein [Bacteroidetes bacterium]|nr:DUF5103 domain-containing protein [Bacteroidota bacterium]
MRNLPKIISGLIFLCLLAFRGTAQDDYANDNQMRYEDWNYKANIKTVQLHETSWEFAPATIAFGSGEQLELSFDDLDADKKFYTVSFVHCDAEWQPSNLVQAEYMNGFYEANFQNFDFSINTLQRYTHYSILFPTQNMQFSKSGNYIAYVYQDNDKDKLILTKRFMIYDNKITVVASVRQAIGNDEQFAKQHIDFNLLNSAYELTNPFTDLKVVITQNNRWDNAVRNIKPTFVEPRQLTYSLDDKSTFNGGNEFRYFDCRSVRTYTERIGNIWRDSTRQYHIDLKTDDSRAFKNYLFYNDLNGGYLIKNQDISGNQDLEADYVYVNFFVPFDNPVSEGNFYILGKFTDWRTSKGNMMTYNYKRFGYECTLYIKQGYYNYTYVYVKDGQSAGDETLTEGNHWETENDYAIYVYHRQRGTYYDQLVAIKRMNSLKK